MFQKSVYYPAISVGTFQAALIENDSYFGKAFRYYEKDVDSFFYYPYLLISAAHNYKKDNLREKINFPRSEEHMLFIDSGGFQLATGALTEDKYDNEKALTWSEQNGDIFPILDRPPYITGQGGADNTEWFKECLKKTVVSAKYYTDNRTRKDTKVLNVLHGRSLKELEYWYSFVHKFKFEGWAGGGIKTLADMLRSILFLKNKGEFSRREKVYFHIFGISKAAFIPYIEYVQHLFNKSEDCNIVISFDSSYPLKTAAFGNYFLHTTSSGITQMNWSNKYKEKYEKEFTDKHRLPCSCPVCLSVVDLKEFLLKPKVFYNITSAHNLYRFFNYKSIVENLIFLNMEELWETSFDSITRRNFKVIEKAFNMKEGVYEFLSRELREIDNTEIVSSIADLF